MNSLNIFPQLFNAYYCIFRACKWPNYTGSFLELNTKYTEEKSAKIKLFFALSMQLIVFNTFVTHALYSASEI